VHARGGRLINWLQDIFPETAEALGLGKSYGLKWLYRLLVSLRNRSRKKGMNVVLGEHMRNRLLALGASAERLRLIANFADGELIKPLVGENSLRTAWSLNERFVVGYSGNLGRAHDYETLLGAITKLEIEDGELPGSARKIAWLFIGGGKNYDILRRMVVERGLRSVNFKPYQTREMLSESLAVADVHIISLNPALEGLIVPSKFYAIAAAGRPAVFVGDKDGEIARQLARYRCGLTVGSGEGEALAQTLRSLAADLRSCQAMGARARRAFEIEFSRPLAVTRWEELLAELAHAT
jgi:colanic acid biosynthesis glycosyl transferase WcaI